MPKLIKFLLLFLHIFHAHTHIQKCTKIILYTIAIFRHNDVRKKQKHTYYLSKMLYCDNPFESACQYDSDCDSDTDITDNSFGSSYQFDSSEDEMENINQKYPDKEDLYFTKQHGDVSTLGKNSLKTQSTKPKFVLHSVLHMFRCERFPFLVSFVTLPVSILKENRMMNPGWYHGVFYVPRIQIRQNDT